MAKRIIFGDKAEKEAAVAAEKAAHPSPTAHQAEHLVALEAAEVVA